MTSGRRISRAFIVTDRVRTRRIKAVAGAILAVLLTAYLGLGLVLYFMQGRFLYRPDRQLCGTPADIGLEFENVTFTSEDDVELAGWFVPAEPDSLTLLFCHGNAGNIGHRLDSIDIFHSLGLNCFIFDYRGYGASRGQPTESGTYLDAAAAYEWLRREKKIAAENIILFGRSLGASVAAHLASRVAAGGVVIESGFTSYADMGKKLYPYMPVRTFARFDYNTAGYLARVRCPVMVVHSADDEIMPYEFGRRLYRQANEPKRFVEISGSHNEGFLSSADVYRRAWAEWLQFVAEHKSTSA